MIKRFLLPVATALLTCSVSQAGLTNVMNTASDGDVSLGVYTIDIANSTVAFGNTNSPVMQTGPGQISADFGVDGDPTLTIQNIINNDTAFAWTSYGVNISMFQTFIIVNPASLNTGWTGSVIQQPVWNGSQYVGQISYAGGTPVAIGNLLYFSYQITFDGNASFGQTLTPNPVPEPGTLSLLAGGILLLLGGRRFAKRS